MTIFLHRLFTILILGFSFQATAQLSPEVQEIEQDYFDYYELNRERVFLHLNKTALIPNEDLWFSAYVYDTRTELPNIETVNLDVAIYNDRGKHLGSQTVLISIGKGAGSIELDPEIFPPGTYLLRASTNYMKNFEEDLSFDQTFTVIGDEEQLPSTAPAYDLQLLPEGGHLVQEVMNSVGVKLIDETGSGVPFTDAKLLNSDDDVVTRFNSNRFGMSKFSFTPEINSEYEVILTTNNGDEIRRKLPVAERKGISLINTIRKDHHILAVRTNPATKADLKERNLVVVLHKDGKLKDFEISFPDNELELEIPIHNDSLFPGVNTITIFDPQLNPLSERKIFSVNKMKRIPLEARLEIRRSDSLSFSISTPQNIKATSLSVSVLPAQTRAYKGNKNVLTAFYLQPYVEGHIDNASYYFSPGDETRKIYDLDLLLMTQGWSKYDWTVPGSKPQERFAHQKGFGIKGRLLNGKKSKNGKLFVGSDDSGLFEVVELDSDNSFELPNSFILDSTTISVGYLSNRNNKLSKPRITLGIHPVKENRDLANIPNMHHREHFGHVPAYLNEKLEDFISLDTVELSTKKREPEGHRTVMEAWENNLEITEEVENRYRYLADYIATKGFFVTNEYGSVSIKNMMLSSFANSRDVLLYINGAPMGRDANFLVGLLSSEVQSITINKRGYGLGGNGVNGVIKINMRDGSEIASRGRTRTLENIVAGNGFMLSREFYTPRYRSYDDKLFQDYGAIAWKPNLVLDASGKTNFTIFNSGQPGVRLFIEGMNSEGQLISESIDIDTGEQQ